MLILVVTIVSLQCQVLSDTTGIKSGRSKGYRISDDVTVTGGGQVRLQLVDEVLRGAVDDAAELCVGN